MNYLPVRTQEWPSSLSTPICSRYLADTRATKIVIEPAYTHGDQRESSTMGALRFLGDPRNDRLA